MRNFNNSDIYPTSFKGYPLYQLKLRSNYLSKNDKIEFIEGTFLVTDIIFYDCVLNMLVFTVDDDIMNYCFVIIK